MNHAPILVYEKYMHINELRTYTDNILWEFFNFRSIHENIENQKWLLKCYNKIAYDIFLCQNRRTESLSQNELRSALQFISHYSCKFTSPNGIFIVQSKCLCAVRQQSVLLRICNFIFMGKSCVRFNSLPLCSSRIEFSEVIYNSIDYCNLGWYPCIRTINSNHTRSLRS